MLLYYDSELYDLYSVNTSHMELYLLSYFIVYSLQYMQ